MWPLIKREAKDVMLFAALPSLFVAIMIAYLAFVVYHSHREGVATYLIISFSIIETCWAPLIVLPGVASLLGVYQIRWDRARGVSTYLATQPTSRRRLLIAKIFTGLVCMALWFIALTITYLWINNKFPHIQPGGRELIINGMAICGLLAITAYMVGLLLAQYGHILISIFAAILLAGLLFCMLMIKGINIQIAYIFTTISLAAVFNAWRRFVTIPL